MSFSAAYDGECACVLDDIHEGDEITYCKRCEGYAHVDCESNCFDESIDKRPPAPVTVSADWYDSVAGDQIA